MTGDLDAPERVLGQRVVARLRVRRDRPGALVALEDGRYAVTGPLIVAGSRDDVTTYARRRARSADPDDRAWLQTVVGALAIDVFDRAPVQGPRPRRPPTSTATGWGGGEPPASAISNRGVESSASG